ncbi:serine/arginine-rich splicing factor 4-like isoform X4 [Tachypleus tridentatus]|uniref:serine/arginine-rich splicing factor 4-like isoform X4 n=1 Tax=Tachypleus tridentatus TaxID=6853 RepID=UPI003FD5EF41
MGTRVYIGRLSHDCRERDLERFFKGYGRIREILIKNGFGFVEFEDYRDADDAVYELNGKDLLGERVIVELARGPLRRNTSYGASSSRRRGSWIDKYGPPTRTEYRVIVENLSSRVSWQDLKDYMRQAGEVTYADAHKQRRNEGVVEFATYSDMKNALDKLDNTELNGRKVRLSEDRSRKRRSRTKSHSRSRSRSPTKSHSRSRSRSRSRSKSASRSSRNTHSRSQSKSVSPERKEKASKSKSRSKSPTQSPKGGSPPPEENDREDRD